MDNSLSESARFAVYREKLKGICEANNLSYVFIKNAYPIKLVIRPLGGVGEQMSMLEEASEDNYISPGASILFTVKDGNLTYRMSKTFTISDTLFNKIKNIFKNMHYLWLQFFFRDLVEGGKLAALGYKMPMTKRPCRTAPTSFLRCMDPAAKRTHPVISAKLLTLNATSAAKLAMTTAMRSSCAERSMANDRPCKV